MKSQFADITLSLIFFFFLHGCIFLVKFSYWSSFLSKLWLFLELWQFSFIMDWPEIQKLEIPPSGFCQISADWDMLWIPNLTRMSLIKSYWFLQNIRVTAYTVSNLLRKNQQGVKLPSPPPRLGLRCGFNSLRG